MRNVRTWGAVTVAELEDPPAHMCSRPGHTEYVKGQEKQGALTEFTYSVHGCALLLQKKIGPFCCLVQGVRSHSASGTCVPNWG